jgi:hypothetical protein
LSRKKIRSRDHLARARGIASALRGIGTAAKSVTIGTVAQQVSQGVRQFEQTGKTFREPSPSPTRAAARGLYSDYDMAGDIA